MESCSDSAEVADWRRTLPPVVAASNGHTHSPSPAELRPPDYATYVRILSWFLDDPSPLCPFSVHRFALKGKELGKDVGEWFGPSTAAGAIRALTADFTPAGLGVATAVDAAAAEPSSSSPEPQWTRPVLVLCNLRLGIEGVTPAYYDALKSYFTFPQAVGIAGGRPSSSYYFLGAQANSLFYIDPHHPKPAVPTRLPPEPLHEAALTEPLGGAPVVAANDEWESVDAAEDDTASEDGAGSGSASDSDGTWHEARTHGGHSRDSTDSAHVDRRAERRQQRKQARRERKAAKRARRRHRAPPPPSAEPSTLEAFFASAYAEHELRSYHCDRVRKMPLSGLDPSMLVGFLCQTEDEWLDLCARLKQVRLKMLVLELMPQMGKAPLLHVADRPPHWARSSSRVPSATVAPTVVSSEGDGEGSDAGVESMSDEWELDSIDGAATSASSPKPSARRVTDVSVADDDEAVLVTSS